MTIRRSVLGPLASPLLAGAGVCGLPLPDINPAAWEMMQTAYPNERAYDDHPSSGPWFAGFRVTMPRGYDPCCR